MSTKYKTLLENEEQWSEELAKQPDEYHLDRNQNIQLLSDKGINAVVKDICKSPLKYQKTRFINELSPGNFEIDFSRVILNEAFSLNLRNDRQVGSLKFNHSIINGDFKFHINQDNISFYAIGAKFKSDLILESMLNVYKNIPFMFGKVDFTEAEFGIEEIYEDNNLVADFSKAVFGLGCCFAESKFFCWANFKNTIFEGTSHFDEATFYELVTFSATDNAKAHIVSKLQFIGAKFLSKKTIPAFDSRVFEAPVTFENATFALAPDFNNSKLHHFTDFRNTNFINKEYNSASYYRNLKLLMEEARNFPMENYFHKLEEQCLRKDEHAHWWEKMASSVYYWGSEYGGNYLAPFLWFWLFQTLAFAGYLYVLKDNLSLDILPLGYKVASVTIEQLFRPITSLKDLDSCLLEFDRLFIRIISLFHFTLSLSAITLFFLALRRRFRMKS